MGVVVVVSGVSGVDQGSCGSFWVRSGWSREDGLI